MSNHAHRRTEESLERFADPQGFFPRCGHFLHWFFGASQGTDRFPRRRTATTRMNAAIRAGYLRGLRRR